MSNPAPKSQLWGSRFSGGPSEALAALSASVHFDWRLARYDPAGSRAHARGLNPAGPPTDADLEALLAGVDALEVDVVSGAVTPTGADAGCHTPPERGPGEPPPAPAR